MFCICRKMNSFKKSQKYTHAPVKFKLSLHKTKYKISFKTFIHFKKIVHASSLSKQNEESFRTEVYAVASQIDMTKTAQMFKISFKRINLNWTNDSNGHKKCN